MGGYFNVKTINLMKGSFTMRNLKIKNNDSLSRKGRGSQSGRSMIEMLGVLAIIGVLSVGGIAGYSKAMQKYRINKTIEQITLIAGNIRSFFAPQKSYAELYSGDPNTGKAIIKKAKLVPDEMWDGNSIKNVWGGTFYIKDWDSSGFEISVSKLPLEACIELATYDWGISSGKYIIFDDSYYTAIPTSLALATELCVDNGDITLIFDNVSKSTFTDWEYKED